VSESKEERDKVDEERVRGNIEEAGGITLGIGGNSMVVISTEGKDMGDKGGLDEVFWTEEAEEEEKVKEEENDVWWLRTEGDTMRGEGMEDD
jgi:hypothetical protein